jgi:hypothetical protein
MQHEVMKPKNENGAERDEGRYDLGRNWSLKLFCFYVFLPLFYPLLYRDHNSDSMVYINRAWIARINVDSSSLNIYFPDAIVFLFANINPSSTLQYRFYDSTVLLNT